MRVDSHVYTGYDIPPFYDSLIGKLIVWGRDRSSAITRMKRALNECAVTGIPQPSTSTSTCSNGRTFSAEMSTPNSLSRT